MRRGRLLVEAGDALTLIESVRQGAEVFDAHVDEIFDRLDPHPRDIGAVLFILGEIARSYMTTRPGGFDAELHRLRLLAMAQSERTPA